MFRTISLVFIILNQESSNDTVRRGYMNSIHEVVSIREEPSMKWKSQIDMVIVICSSAAFWLPNYLSFINELNPVFCSIGHFETVQILSMGIFRLRRILTFFRPWCRVLLKSRAAYSLDIPIQYENLYLLVSGQEPHLHPAYTTNTGLLLNVLISVKQKAGKCSFIK